jgi:hypothetical protein
MPLVNNPASRPTKRPTSIPSGNAKIAPTPAPSTRPAMIQIACRQLSERRILTPVIVSLTTLYASRPGLTSAGSPSSAGSASARRWGRGGSGGVGGSWSGMGVSIVKNGFSRTQGNIRICPLNSLATLFRQKSTPRSSFVA